jgi:hypothetical protein
MTRKLKTVLTNFSSGELNPLLAARIDTPAYVNGARQCRNFSILAEGGLMRRPGTQYLATLPASDCRLIPFVFSDDEIAIIVLSQYNFTIYDIDGGIIQAATGSANTTPWTAGTLFELNFAQFGDTVFITHPSFRPVKIFRSSSSTFTASFFEFDEDTTITQGGHNKKFIAFYKYAASTISLTLSAHAVGTNRTVTASAAFFDASFNLNAAHNNRLLINGKQCVITAVTNTTVAIVSVLEDVVSSGPHFDWAEQIISDRRGYPQAVTFHGNRLWFGGLLSKPAAILASRTAEYTNFDVGTGSVTDAINIDVGGSEVNEVRHFLSGKELQVFTDSGEFYIPRATDNTISPGNVTVLKQTPFGINKTAPVMFDQAALFCQKTGKSIREFIFSDMEDGYKANSVSLLAQHLIVSPKEIAVLKGNNLRPEQYAFFLNTYLPTQESNLTEPNITNPYVGSLAVFHSIRDEKLAGWTLWTPGQTSTEINNTDTFQSIITLNEHLVCITRRTLQGGTHFILEKFGEDDSVTLDMQTISTIYSRGTLLVQGASQTGTVLKADGFTSAPRVGESITIAGITPEFNIEAVTDNGGGSYNLTLSQTLPSSPSDNASITMVKSFTHVVNTEYSSNKVFAVNGNSSLGEYLVDAPSNTIDLNVAYAAGVKIGFNYECIVETMPIDKELPNGPLTGTPRRISRAIIDLNSTLDLTVKASDKTSKSLIIQQVSFTGGSDLVPFTNKKEFLFMGYDINPTITLSQNQPLPLKILGMNVEVVFA